MSYHLDKMLEGMSMAEAEQKVREALMARGFGVLTEIDVSGTLKKKLDVDFPGYKILGACHAPTAYEALKAEPTIGIKLPCNVVLREVEGGVMVHAVNPANTWASHTDNDALKKAAGDGSKLIREVLDSL
jgi:uncharacterized protein (DUF302 family)